MPPTADGAKAFNRQLRHTAAVLSGHAGGDHKYGFVCECGCEQTVMLTLQDYDRQGGAWLKEHKRTDR